MMRWSFAGNGGLSKLAVTCESLQGHEGLQHARRRFLHGATISIRCAILISSNTAGTYMVGLDASHEKLLAYAGMNIVY